MEHLGGPLCEVPIEMMCLNACNGHGDCMSGSLHRKVTCRTLSTHAGLLGVVAQE